MDELVRVAGGLGVHEIVIGMAHRGRLNVLVNTLGNSPQQLFSEFEGKHAVHLSAGDVKYQVNAKAIIQKDQWVLLFVTLLAWGGYTLLYYQMDNTDGTLFSNGGWMLSGYKRGVFVYAPLCLCYVATSKHISWLFAKLDDMVSFAKN